MSRRYTSRLAQRQGVVPLEYERLIPYEEEEPVFVNDTFDHDDLLHAEEDVNAVSWDGEIWDRVMERIGRFLMEVYEVENVHLPIVVLLPGLVVPDYLLSASLATSLPFLSYVIDNPSRNTSRPFTVFGIQCAAILPTVHSAKYKKTKPREVTYVSHTSRSTLASTSSALRLLYASSKPHLSPLPDMRELGLARMCISASASRSSFTTAWIRGF